MSADVAGYSRLMADDEQATVAALEAAREVFAKHVMIEGGRIVDATGDSVLAEFPTASGAVTAALRIQAILRDANAGRPEPARMQWRIGINLGEVLEREGALYGDGVNVAARIQGLAQVGGVCASASVAEQVRETPDARFSPGGEHSVKNIEKPIRVFHVTRELPGSSFRAVRTRRPVALRMGVGALVVALVAVLAVSWQVQRQHAATEPEQRPPGAAADPVLSMPSGPRLAVLPFVNMSGSSREEYFADGLTEDIITELARFQDLSVLARNTTYQYKGKSVDVADVGRKLGVQYVLEGSARRSFNQVRITAQLIDVATGAHLWAERYDRDARDIFLIQDEIAHRIAGSIAGGREAALQRDQRRSIERKSENQLRAYDYILRATVMHEWWAPHGYPKAKRDLLKAIELDPENARARQTLAWQMLVAWIFRYEETDTPPSDIKRNAVRAVELDPSNALAQAAAAFGYYFDKEFEQFERSADAALRLAPNNPEVLAPLSFLIAIHGNWARGVQLANKARDLNPATAAGWTPSTLFYDFLRRGMYREALEILKEHSNPGIVENLQKYTAVYAELGDLPRAREYWEKCKAIDPEWSADKLDRLGRDLWSFDPEFWTRYMRSIAKAGYPAANR